MKALTTDHPWPRRILPLVSVAAIALAQHLLPAGETHWQAGLTRLYAVPVVLAGLLAGWRFGLAAALLSSAALYSPLLEGPRAEETLRPLEAVVLAALGLLAGGYADRQKHKQKRYQDVAAKLSSVYESLQVNFEGMKRAERLSAIGHLSAGLAHEIRNPLGSIAGAASILRRTVTTDPKSARCIEIIETECGRLNNLLTSFLNFARPRSPQFQRVDLHGILAGVIELAEHAVNRRQVHLRNEIAGGLTEIECDPEQLRQVLLNLLINAIEASGEGATVTLSAVQEDGALVLRVIDEGSGVAPEDIDKLFDPFFTTKETGTGLGLPVAHQIIGHMGGTLSARRNSSRGMTFSIVLPFTRRTTT